MNYLITGVSGTGKTAIGIALQNLGYSVIHADEQIAAKGRDGRWVWDAAKLIALLSQHKGRNIFVCGGADNERDFLPLFHRVFLLRTAPRTRQARIAERRSGEDRGEKFPADFGGKAIILDTTHQPVRATAFAILRRIG